MTDLQIRCFLEVANCLSFTNAAKKLFISQSNISRQIAALEDEWQIPLFDRNTKGVKLTLQGQMLAEKLEEMSSELDAVMTRARNSVKKFSGSITIGCQDQVKANSYLSQLLYGFREIHPEIQIVKERCTQKKLVDGLQNDYYDVIFIADHDVKKVNKVEKQTLFSLELGVVLHKSHPLFHKKSVTLDDLKDCLFLRYHPLEMDPHDDYLTKICESHGFRPLIGAEIENFDDLLFAVEMGEGVAIIFEEMEVITNKSLRFIPIEDEIPDKYMAMQLIRKKHNQNTAMNDLFIYASKYASLHKKKDI